MTRRRDGARTLNSFDPDDSLLMSNGDLRGVNETIALSFLDFPERTGLDM